MLVFLRDLKGLVQPRLLHVEHVKVALEEVLDQFLLLLLGPAAPDVEAANFYFREAWWALPRAELCLQWGLVSVSSCHALKCYFLVMLCL